ncbi:hypothetical protein TR75_04565 [Hydrogenibacillus schlegelii]|nr:hypothetical protein TR75_04565 [Hydrogenibacillus schlegelii]
MPQTEGVDFVPQSSSSGFSSPNWSIAAERRDAHFFNRGRPAAGGRHRRGEGAPPEAAPLRTPGAGRRNAPRGAHRRPPGRPGGRRRGPFGHTAR